MKRIVILIITLLATAIAGAADPHKKPAPPSDARFEFLKELAGVWTGIGLDGKPGGTYEFRVTAGGSAVREIEMVGTPMEMVTLYTMEGKNLVATHYCMMGNQPELLASREIRNDTLAFECAGTPRNARSHDDHHVHGWAMRLDEEGRLHYSAELAEAGAVTEAPTVILTRAAD